MQYKNVVSGVFIDRPNRFLAHVKINKKIEVVHVRNTGRCHEILIPGTGVYLEKVEQSKKRKTQYSLISAYKNTRLINIDSQIPNALVANAVQNKNILQLNPLLELKREVNYCSSRFDIMYKSESQKGFIEVKGVTLEKDCVAQFPDAPTIRGTKHIQELIKSSQDGYNNYIVFVIQMKGVKYFSPNDKMDSNFGAALRSAQFFNVKIKAYDCFVEKNSIVINQPIKIIL